MMSEGAEGRLGNQSGAGATWSAKGATTVPGNIACYPLPAGSATFRPCDEFCNSFVPMSTATGCMTRSSS